MSEQKLISYPKIPHDKKKNVKITLADKIEINKLIHVKGLTTKQVAEMYRVSEHCIRYNTDPHLREREIESVTTAQGLLYGADFVLRFRRSRGLDT